MRNEDKLIKVAHYNTKLNSVLGFDYSAFTIYRSKGLLTHLIKRKHFVAAKYIDRLDDIISHPDYIIFIIVKYNGKLISFKK